MVDHVHKSPCPGVRQVIGVLAADEVPVIGLGNKTSVEKDVGTSTNGHSRKSRHLLTVTYDVLLVIVLVDQSRSRRLSRIPETSHR